MKRFFKSTCCALIVPAMALAAASFARAEEQCQWITLFDGTDLSAWDNCAGGPPGAGWVIEDGAVTRKQQAGYIWTKEKYGDFVLELEFNTQGNSGVFFRTGNPKDCVQTGLEMQVHRPTENPNKNSVGSLYDALAPSKNAAVDGWNKVVLTAKGSRITIDLNGERIIDADLDQWTEAGKNPDGSKNKYRTALKDFPREGYIGLQEHGDVVSYRNIRVRPL
jgi:hypothetical protein